MDTESLIFRTVLVDRDVDTQVLAHAKRLKTKPGSVYRLFLEAGLEELAHGAALPPVSADATVLRTAHLSVTSDDRLTGLACRLGIDKSGLIQSVAILGMQHSKL